MTCSIGSGDHTVRWSYDKDENYRAGSDRGRLDQVAFTVESPATTRLALHNTRNTQISLTMPVPIGAGIVVEYRDSLGTDDPWKVLMPSAVADPGKVASDFIQPNRSRFYRIRLQE
jgi:hypothetical protein